jgi:hypothetical protein
MYNLTYDTPYNRKIVDELAALENRKKGKFIPSFIEPDHLEHRYSGGVRCGDYLQHGSNNSYPPYHMDEAMRLAGAGFSGGYCHTCGGALNIRGALSRAKRAIAPYAHNFYHEAIKPVAEKAFETAKEQARSYLNNKLKKATGGKRPVGRPRKSGGFNWGALGDIAADIAKPIATDLATKGINTLLAGKRGRGRPKKSGAGFVPDWGKAIGTIGEIAKQPAVKDIAKDLAKRGVDKLLGNGRKPRGRKPKQSGAGFLDVFSDMGKPFEKMVGVNPFDAGFQLGNKVIGPALMGEGRKRTPSKRNIIVKQIMKEKGLSLPQASKYVKENNLY